MGAFLFKIAFICVDTILIRVSIITNVGKILIF